MKLHHPKKLTAALVAAITAACFTLPQAIAQETPLTLTIPSNGQIISSNSSLNWIGSTSAGLSSWKLTFELDPGTDLPRDIFNLHADTLTAGTGYHLTIDTSTSLTLRDHSNADLATVDISGRTPITLSFVQNVNEDGVSCSTGTFYLSSNGGTVQEAAVTQSGTSGDYNTTFHPGSGSNSGDTRFWTNSGRQKIYNITLTQLDDNVIQSANWQGADGNNRWEAANFNPVFTSCGDVIFGEASCKTVIVDSVVCAGNVKVDTGNYSFAISGDGSLAAGMATIADGASLTILGEGPATICALSGAGNLTVGRDGIATVNGLINYTGVLGVADGGTLNLGSNVTVSELTVEDGTVNLGKNVIVSNLTVERGTVTTTHSSGSSVVTNTLTIGADGTFKVMGDGVAFGYGIYANRNIVMQGAEGHLATLALEQATIDGGPMTTNVAMHGYSAITVKDGARGFYTYGGNITVDGVENSIAVIDLFRNVTIEVVAEGELSVGKFTQYGTSMGAVTKTGEGIIIIEDASVFPGTLNINEGGVSIKANTTIADLNIATEGTLTVASGTTTVSGNSNVIRNTIGIGSTGVLNLTGMYDVSDIASDGGVEYVGGEGIHEGNGFKKINGLVHVLDIEEGGRFSQAGATFNYGGMTYQLNASGAIDELSGPDYSTLYVNNDGDVSYAAAQMIAEQHEAGIAFVVLNATGTTITMDAEASVALSMASAAEFATILDKEDITLSSIAGPNSGKSLIFSADGHTITVQGNNTFKGNLVVDKGTVKLDAGGSKKVLGEFNGNHAKGLAAPAPDKTITINEGGIIDLNGKADLTYVYTLNGGSLVNNGAVISSTSMQTVGLILEADSSIGGTGDFYLLGPGYDNTFVTLNNHKLTKTGTNSVGFRNTNVTEGIIEVKQGNIAFIDGDNSSLAADIVLDGGSISGTVRSAGEISITALQETTLNGLTLRTGQVDIIGTVNVSGGALDLSNSRASTGIICVTAEGELNVNSDMRMHSSAGIDFAEGGAMNIINLNIVGNAEASIRTTAENQLYGTNNAKFTIANAVITATADVTIGNTLVECDVVTDAHAVTLSNAASTYGDITVSEGGRLIANADMTISGTLKIAGSGMQASNAKVSMRSMDGSSMQIKASTDISETGMLGVGGKGVLENLSMSTSANYTIENMSISGSLIDVGDGTTLYLVNVDIKSDTHITDEAAWLDMVDTHGWLDKDNTQVVKEYTTAQDASLFKSGDTGRSITLAAGTEIVELTSDMFDTVTMTGTDLWLDMTGIAEATYNKDYFTLDFQNLAHSLENAQVDVENLHVYATLDGERYTEAYSTANGGLTTTLYFQVPEPTTSTLSLLALAALAARRRRK